MLQLRTVRSSGARIGMPATAPKAANAGAGIEFRNQEFHRDPLLMFWTGR
jgi:hypothetical protein